MSPVYPQTTTYFLNDKITGQPVPFAHVRIMAISAGEAEQKLADQGGVIESKIKPPVIITVTCLGYSILTDTVTNTGSDTLRLSPDYYALDRVVVTGQFRPQAVDRSIYTIHVIDNRQITLKAANNLGDLMRNNPGFQYRPEGILGDFIRIRGLTGEHIKILIDGMPVTGRQGDRIELDQLNLNAVDHIEIIEGPMSIIYGSNAMAGAINLISADYSKSDLTAAIHAYYETIGIYNADGTFSKRLGKHTFSMNVGRNFNSGWGPVDTARDKIWKPKLQYVAWGAYNYQTAKLKLHFTSNFLNEQLRDLGPLTLENLYEKALDGYHYTTRLNNSLNLTNQMGKHLLLNIQTGYSYYQKRKITYLNDLVNLTKTVADNPLLQDTTRFHEFTNRSYISGSYEKFEYQTGIDFSYETVEGKRTQGKQDITDIAGFFNAIYKPFNFISLQPGLRIMHNSKFNAQPVYAFNVKYNQGNYTLRASYAKGFNAPSLKQLYLEFIDNNHTIYGNPSLKAETGDSYSLSADYTVPLDKSFISLKADVFYNSMQNAIQLAVDTARPGWGIYFNVERNRYKTKGVDLNVSSYLFSRLTLNGGMITTGQSKIDESGKYVYSTDLSFSGSYRIPKINSELAIFFKHTDKYLEFAGNFDASGQLDGVAQLLINGYNTMDLTLSKYMFRQKLMVSAGVKNLFNVTLVNSIGNLNFHGSSGNDVAMAYGRTFFIKLGYQFDKE
jgi:outer membrane receptor for ferrienterochelin and colicins